MAEENVVAQNQAGWPAGYEVGADREGLALGLDHTLGLIDIGLPHGGPDIVHAEPVRSERGWVRLDPDGRRILLAALEDGNPNVRAAAVEAMGKREELGEQGAEALLRAADDSNDSVKVEVAKALPRLADVTPAVVDRLCGLLDDDNATVQALTAQALGRLGPAWRSRVV